MKQKIVGYYQDEEGHWVARLACGHGQHVRHDPPLVSRPWVLTEEGRTSRLGQLLDCVRCDEEKEQAVMMESQVVVSFDAGGITAVYPDGTSSRVLWPELESILIETNDTGPWGSDVWWVLHGSAGECHFPMGASGEQEMLARLQQLDGFDNHALIDAMMSTDNRIFVCWQKNADAPLPSN